MVGESLDLKCHSFLSVYIQSSSYGRTLANGQALCDGARPADRTSPGADCLESQQMLQHTRSLCHGQASCEVPVAGDMADFTGCMLPELQRELRTNHICGKKTFLW